ncbi:hypothetical protein AVEN_166749-1 [Araneus ventricosus]|uniref:Transposable element Tc1 transposase n=1 Tax=Araneus ventricosus TaxID=182803 RepID=A0A4Y2BP36_ARAVE|nr:hypothetical protein AVEN_166749-1 [Araneus ventricosus]
MGSQARSLDLKPIEPVWDTLERRITALKPIPATLQDLRTTLMQQWVLLPTELINTIILRIEHRCRACMAVKGRRVQILLHRRSVMVNVCCVAVGQRLARCESLGYLYSDCCSE